MEQVGQAGEQVLLAPRLTAVRQDLFPERPTEVQSLQHRVAVAGVPKLKKSTYGIENNQRVDFELSVEFGECVILRTLTRPK